MGITVANLMDKNFIRLAKQAFNDRFFRNFVFCVIR